MTAPALARGQTGRRYVWPPNTDKPELVVPSVTTILGQLSKPALTNWAAKSVAEYAVEQILAWQDLPPADAIDLLKRAPYRNMTGKQNIGSAVHAAIDVWLGREETVLEDPELLPFLGGALAFLEDLVKEVLSSEVTVFNRTYQYAGTVDLIALLKDGRIAICDWKTGRAIYPETAIQMAAYSHGEFVGADDGTELPMPGYELMLAEYVELGIEMRETPYQIGIVVHLPGDGTYTARETELDGRAWKTFVALRSIQKWRDDFEADALGKVHKGSTKAVEK